MYRKILSIGHTGMLFIEDLFNRVFSPRFNPFYYLGAIAFFFLWFVLGSGIYLLFYYRINVDEAYNSLEYLTKEQWWLGGIMRSIHRYASDGLMLAMVLHLVREFLNDRYRNWRWVAWVSGVALMIVFWVEGITGYWMVWDQRSLVIASITTKFIDFLPVFGEPLARAFLSNSTVSNLLFIGIIFLHLSLPTLLLIAAWIHLVRISRPIVNPPSSLNKAIGILLFAMCLIVPATSQMPADLTIAAARFGIDWLYLPIYPLMATLPVWYSWLIVGGGTIILAFLPWTIKSERLAKADIILENCNGCELCFKDCPYEAIYMRKRTDNKPYEFEAVVVEKKCASCGLCVGACDFHAVDLLDRTENQIKDEITKLLRLPADDGSDKSSFAPQAINEQKILAVVCGYGVQMKGLINPDTRALKDMPNVRIMLLPCVAMLQPSMMEHAFAKGADGIFISGCETNDCHFREGNNWLEQRLLNSRPPVLKKKAVDPKKIRVAWLSAVHTNEFFNELMNFNNELKTKKIERKMIAYQFIKSKLTFSGIAILTLASAITLYLSDAPYTFFKESDSLLVFSFKHSGKPSKIKKALPDEELQRLPKHMRPKGEVVLKRFPVYAEVNIDGRMVMSKAFKPAGMWQNGSSFAFERIVVEPGKHNIIINLSESNNPDKFDYTYEDIVDFEQGKAIAFDFDEKERKFIRVQ